jgi:hypothetical protein
MGRDRVLTVGSLEVPLSALHVIHHPTTKKSGSRMRLPSSNRTEFHSRAATYSQRNSHLQRDQRRLRGTPARKERLIQLCAALL